LQDHDTQFKTSGTFQIEPQGRDWYAAPTATWPVSKEKKNCYMAQRMQDWPDFFLRKHHTLY
jgi:hypothetical protein